MKLDFRPAIFDGKYSTLTECIGFTPADAGYVVSYTGKPFHSTALAGNCLGARAIKTESGSVRLFLGSAAKIEEYLGPVTGLVDRSKAGGYSTGSNRWWFTQGLANSEVIATNFADSMQISTGTSFSNLSGSPPKAKIVLSQNNALLALNYDDGTAVPNGIRTSNRGSSTQWDTATYADCVAIKLVQSPGAIVAAATLHDLVVVWKQSSMYVGRFVGGDEKWQFNLLSPNVGCYGIEAWCNTPAGIVFSGEAGTYLFDGSVPRPIDQGVRQAIQDKMHATNSWGADVALAHDEALGCIFIYIPDPKTSVGNANGRFSCFAYNYRTDKWSQPYPFYNDGDTKLGSDWGYKTGANEYTDFQAAVRDFGSIDAQRVNSGYSPTELVGHFVVPSQKHILGMNGIVASPNGDISVSNVEVQMRTGTFRPSESWASDSVLRRVGLVPTGTSYKYGTSNFNTGSFYCTASLALTADVRPLSEIGSTFTFSPDDIRFDGFATGKAFTVVVGSKDARWAVHDLWFDIGPSGKT